MTIDHQDDERRRRRLVVLGVAAVVGLVLVAAVVAWLVARGGDDEEPEPTRATAEGATLEDLQALAASADGPVFWAGPRPGTQYELSQTSDGRIYIRYLPMDVQVGDPRANYLTVGTYPSEDALAEARRSGELEGGVTREIAGGGLAVYNESTPTSVYLAFPGINRLVEVYDPSPETARQLAYSGTVVPIVAEDEEVEQPGRPVAATQDELEELAPEVEHPVYWLGPREGVTYELTRLPNGQIYIRYLPEGVDVGDHRPEFETVGTYPVSDGLASIEEAASGADDAVTFDLPGGGHAYYREATPTNVHFALPDSQFQVEVFHPTAGRAEELVRAGDVVPIR